MSSTDGFCSTLSFAPGELGQIYTGHHPTLHHPSISTTLANSSSASTTPVPTPTSTVSPALAKASPAPIPPPPSHPSPAPTFSVRPGSPTRSNSQSSVATMASIQASNLTNNPTPTLGHVPLAIAAGSGPQVTIPSMTTPPQTPMGVSGGHSATSSVSGSVLGKRDVSGASESEEDNRSKKRRIAPTPVNITGVKQTTPADETKSS